MDSDLDSESDRASDIESDIDPYDIRTEELPDDIVHRDIFRQLQEMNRTASQMLLKPFEESTYHNDYTKALLKDGRKRTKVERLNEIAIAIAGEMGSGTFCIQPVVDGNADGT